MRLEGYILLAVWVVALGGMLFVPRERRRESHVVFLFQQLLAWILGLIVVEMGLLDYPYRELQTNRTSFTFEFLAYPMVAVYYNLYYPGQRGAFMKLLYTVAFSAGITLPEIWIEKHTQLIQYHGWKWYYTFVSIGLTLFAARLFRDWFLQKAGQPTAGKD